MAQTTGTAQSTVSDDRLLGEVSSNAATITAALSTAATLTLAAPGAGLRHYITGLRIERHAAALLTAGTTPVVVTTTNLPGALAFSIPLEAAAQGSVYEKWMEPARAIMASLRADVKVDTIDSYQGKENPIVIVSLVRNNFEGPMQDGSRTIRPGFLAKENRINVAISRAMDRLVLVGSATRWERGGPMDRISIAFANHVANGQAAKVDAAVFLDGSLEVALPRPTTIETLETVK